jgi:hypothetical protein
MIQTYDKNMYFQREFKKIEIITSYSNNELQFNIIHNLND